MNKVVMFIVMFNVGSLLGLLDKFWFVGCRINIYVSYFYISAFVALSIVVCARLAILIFNSKLVLPLVGLDNYPSSLKKLQLLQYNSQWLSHVHFHKASLTCTLHNHQSLFPPSDQCQTFRSLTTVNNKSNHRQTQTLHFITFLTPKANANANKFSQQ